MSLRILIVDDETNARRSLAISLKLAGHRVHDAADGYAALAVLESDPIDLALVDLMMPDMSGLELARQINVRHQHVRVVLVSAYHLSKRQLERMDCGAIGFVPKPFEMDELLAFIERKSVPPSVEIEAEAVNG